MLVIFWFTLIIHWSVTTLFAFLINLLFLSVCAIYFYMCFYIFESRLLFFDPWPQYIWRDFDPIAYWCAQNKKHISVPEFVFILLWKIHNCLVISIYFVCRTRLYSNQPQKVKHEVVVLLCVRRCRVFLHKSLVLTDHVRYIEMCVPRNLTSLTLTMSSLMWRAAHSSLFLLKSITNSFVFEELSVKVLSELQAVSFWTHYDISIQLQQCRQQTWG